jgi:Ser/Thr protein kinase RdoA (MazF antagonist)
VAGPEDARDWVRSVPGAAAVRRFVETRYGFAVTGVVLVRSSGNDVYRVDTTGRSYALKVHGAGRWTPDEVRWEQELARHLADSGLPIAAAVPLADGDTVGILTAPEGERPVAMAEWVPGRKPQPPGTDDLYRDLGRSVAQFHLAADGFRSSRPRRTVRTDSDVREVSDALGTDSTRRRLVEAAGAEAQRQIARLAGRGLHRGIRHGDASLDNVHVSDSGLHVYDLDLAGPGWQVEDLTPPSSTGFGDAFLAGYTAVRPLSPVELEALPWLRVMNCIQNLHFHLVGKPALQGTASLADGGVEAGLEALAAAARPLGLDL